MKVVKLFTNIYIAGQKAKKTQPLVDMLDNDYGITLPMDITDKTLKSDIVVMLKYSNWDALTNRDIVSIKVAVEKFLNVKL